MTIAIPAYIEALLLIADVAIGLIFIVGTLRISRALDIPRAERIRVVVSVSGLVVGWFIVALILAKLGAFQASIDTLVPYIALGIAAPIVIGVLLLRYSRAHRRIAIAAPQHWLVGVQLYRCLGAIFLVLYARQLLPDVFAFPAGFGDILVGALAPVIAYLVLKRSSISHRLVIGWNVLGIADLVLAVTLGFLSSPTRFQLFALDAPNVLVSAYPLAMIPVFAVPMSILLHIVSLKALAAAGQPRAAAASSTA